MSELNELKTWPQFLDAIKQGRKRFELRLDDRDFQVGDLLDLRGWNPGENCWTGDRAIVRVDYVLHWQSFPGLKKNYVCMSITPLDPRP